MRELVPSGSLEDHLSGDVVVPREEKCRMPGMRPSGVPSLDDDGARRRPAGEHPPEDMLLLQKSRRSRHTHTRGAEVCQQNDDGAPSLARLASSWSRSTHDGGAWSQRMGRNKNSGSILQKDNG